MSGDWSRSLALVFLFHFPTWASQLPAQTPPPATSEILATIKNLYQGEQWEAVLKLVPPSPDQIPELDYYRGMALARLQRWQEAREAFESGEKKSPTDKRFPLELAGISFQTKSFSQAKAHLARALKLDGQDSYAYEFLASLYFLEGNLEAAIKYWNRIGKPKIQEIKMRPQPRLRAELLDRAFALAPASLLKLEDLRATQTNLDLFGIYPRYRFELSPRQDQKFDLMFYPVEKNGWGNSKLEGVFSVLKGVPYQTVYWDFFNLRQSALNFESLLRWDAQKRRAFSSLSGAWRRNPKWQYRLHFDARKENWDLSRTYWGAIRPEGDLRIQEQSAGAEILANLNPRWRWKSGFEWTHRQFRNVSLGITEKDQLFPRGSSLKYKTGFDIKLVEIPERRFTAQSFATWELGRMFRAPYSTFTKVRGGVLTRWLPQSQGDDYAVTTQFRCGASHGPLPFDEFFILGLERDNDLWMRGHIGTHNGKKGAGFLGRDYILFNGEMDKIVYQHAFFDIRLGPFLDSGRIFDEVGRFGSKEWLWDVGAQVKVRVLGGATFIFSYGKDLRSGGNAFYTTISSVVSLK